jgi:hypothetical protein
MPNPLVDPALLARLREVPGCGKNDRAEENKAHEAAFLWGDFCDDCFTLLIDAIGAAVEEQTIERGKAALSDGLKVPSRDIGTYDDDSKRWTPDTAAERLQTGMDALAILDALPRQWGRKDGEMSWGKGWEVDLNRARWAHDRAQRIAAEILAAEHGVNHKDGERIDLCWKCQRQFARLLEDEP